MISEADIDGAILAMKRCPDFITRRNKARTDGFLWEVIEDRSAETGLVSEETIIVVGAFVSEDAAKERARGLFWRSRAVAALSATRR